jgi:ParB family transcriptional regulator, chromosome partitioning protein
MGHARAIISVDDPETQLMLYQQAIQYDFSVRKVEEVVRQLTTEGKEVLKKSPVKHSLPDKYGKYRDKLNKKLGTVIALRRNEKGKGKIIISFESDAELERIFKMLDEIE